MVPDTHIDKRTHHENICHVLAADKTDISTFRVLIRASHILRNQGGYGGGGLQLGKYKLDLENLKVWELKLSNQRKVDLIRYEKFLPGKIMPYDRYRKMPAATINVRTLLGSYMLQNVGSSILPAMKCQLPAINVRYISYSRYT